MVWTGPVGQHYAIGGIEMIPPPLAVRPELTADDVAWLNAQMALTDRPPVRYARELPVPPPPSGKVPHSAELAKLRDRFLAQQGKPPMWIR